MFDVEENFFEKLDPLYHIKHASFIRYSGDIGKHYKANDAELTDFELGQELVSGLDEARAFSMRFLRFHAADTLLTILCGAPPHGPLVRFSSKFRFDKFNSALEAIGDGAIPAALSIADVECFDEWINRKFFANSRGFFNSSLPQPVIEFIRQQARFVSHRGVYNAFKHGCRFGAGSPLLQMQHPGTGEWFDILKIKNGVTWFEWEFDRATKSEALNVGSVSCDIEDDHAAILAMAMLVRAMKVARLAKPGTSPKFDIPSRIAVKETEPNHMTLKLNFGAP